MNTIPAPFQTEAQANPQARIALVSFDSLGDGLIYLMMADNLRINGFDVTCYGNIAHQMRAWLPDLRTMPYPPADLFEAELAQYDLAIVSPPSFIRANMDEATTARLRENWLLICQKTPESWLFDHTERVQRLSTPEKFRQLQPLLDSSGSIRFRPFADESAVEIALQYMQHKMHLGKLVRKPTIAAPDGLKHCRFPKRIVVSPDSAGPEKKNWRPASFLKLCRRLKALGYSPEIVVAPKNHKVWANRVQGEFPTPQFDDISKLAAHLYESGTVVANDSGNGHLASFLGIPVVTIYRKKNPKFHWRPDWGPATVICPKLSLPWWKDTLWKYCVSLPQIISAVETFHRSRF